MRDVRRADMHVYLSTLRFANLSVQDGFAFYNPDTGATQYLEGVYKQVCSCYHYKLYSYYCYMEQFKVCTCIVMMMYDWFIAIALQL
jgi:hypothetical protein